ncbi:MAG: NAD(P)-dependent oxidoreductase [Cyanobacteria bacterium J06639_1]
MELSGKTLLITGIGGFIGLRTAEMAIARGMKVKGLQRSEAGARAARDLGADVTVGSVTDPAIAATVCRGADVVLHAAARVKEGGSFADFRRANVDGTLTMARAARESDVTSFIHLSSVMVYGFSYPNLATEDAPLRDEGNPYCTTKIEAERELIALNHPPEFGVIVLRPGDVYGPRGTGWVLQPLSLMRNNTFIVANGGAGVINHVYIDNLVEAIFLAIAAECYGQTFNITDGATTSWYDYFARIAAIAGHSPRLTSLPGGMLKTMIRLRGWGQKLLGRECDLFPDSVDFMTRPYPYSIAKAKTLLGYEPAIDLDRGMELTRQWLAREGLIPPTSDLVAERAPS